ncbi:hypothetical protein HID58_074824 [Brassica napus]|uniref:peptidylprolyl isomerase n=1 Tax=Brassica napus TaxID=3708 RepID=A0ABQ7YI50_BRANA|nr:hypothetical protein HID58_074824 [Brassica napus]
MPPVGGMNDDDDMDLGDDASFLKVGEEKEIQQGLKKKLIKEGEGFETPDKFKAMKLKVIKGWDIAGVWGIWLPANATLQFDVELLSWSSVKDICKDGGVFNKIREKWETPKDLDEVLVKYESKLEDGTVVGKSDGVEFTVKDGYFCPALAKAVKTMKKAEKVLLMVQPQLAEGIILYHHTLSYISFGSLVWLQCLISSEAINQDEIGNCGYVVYLQVLLINTSLMFLHMRLICSIVEDSSDNLLYGDLPSQSVNSSSWTLCGKLSITCIFLPRPSSKWVTICSFITPCKSSLCTTSIEAVAPSYHSRSSEGKAPFNQVSWDTSAARTFCIKNVLPAAQVNDEDPLCNLR